MRFENRIIDFLRKGANSAGFFLRLLTESAETSGENNKTNNAANGGVFNFRTDNLDDGTDPVGWYGND